MLWVPYCGMLGNISCCQVRPVYIREAYRLLQQSIIFVDMEDIELESDEMALADPAGDNDDEEEAAPVWETDQAPGHSRADINVGPQPTVGSKRDGAAVLESEDVLQGDLKRHRKDKKVKTQLPYHEYRAMTQFIAIHLRQEVCHGLC